MPLHNPMQPPLHTSWQVGDWRVEPDLNRIVGPDGPVRLTPKALATLCCLAEHQGTLVSRDTLMATVWAGTVVSDDTLNRAISDLRRAFTDNPQQPQVIETIRQRGYRLLLPAEPIIAASGDGTAQPPTLALPPRPQPHAPRRLWPVASFVGVALVLAIGFVLTRAADTPARAVYRAVPLTTYPGLEFDVALSPDGEQIAFAGTSEDLRRIDLYVKQVGVETPLRLTDDDAIEISPAWAPDGRSVAYLRSELGEGTCSLMVRDLPGGDARSLATCETFLVTGVSWSPDGRTIAFSDRPDPDTPFRIYLLDVATRTVIPLTDPPGDLFGDFSATFSPDGRSIGFIRGTVAGTTALMLAPAVGDVHVMRLDDRQPQRLTFDNQEIPHIDWMPDGERLVFASNRERGTSGLWMVDVDGGPPTWVFGDDAFVRKPTVARQTGRLVFEQWVNDVSIWQAAVDSLAAPDAVRPLIRSTRFDAMPQYSPDGTRLAFISQRSGATELWVSDADGQHPIQLTTFGGPYTSTPQWSPDGRQLVFESRTDGQTDLYVIDAHGGLPQRLTDHPREDLVPSWSGDGQRVYFGSNRSGTWQVWQRPIAGGPAQQVTHDGGFRALEVRHAEGPVLYHSSIDQPGLRRLRLDGSSAEEVIVPDMQHADWGSWAATAEALYYLTRSPTRLVRYDYATGRADTLGRLRYLPYGMAGLALTPDGGQVAFVQQRHQAADLWTIEAFE